MELRLVIDRQTDRQTQNASKNIIVTRYLKSRLELVLILFRGNGKG